MKVPSDPEWFAQGNCRAAGPDVMVGRLLTDGRYSQPGAEAKRYCQGCPVADICLETAMRNPELLGVWGGLTTRERADRRNRRNRRTAA